jgi:hypothetical protein
MDILIRTRTAGKVAAMIPARLCGCPPREAAHRGGEVRVRR